MEWLLETSWADSRARTKPGEDAGATAQQRWAELRGRSPRTVRSREAEQEVEEESLSALHHFDEPPALGPRQGPALPHDHGVADVGIPVLVVRVQRRGRPNDLAVLRVPTRDVDSHRDRLGRTVGDHDALPGLLGAGPHDRAGGQRL